MEFHWEGSAINRATPSSYIFGTGGSILARLDKEKGGTEKGLRQKLLVEGINTQHINGHCDSWNKLAKGPIQ